MGKVIVTHFNPDLDAVVSVWLVKRWLSVSSADRPGWEEADFKFVPAGKTYKGRKVDSDPEVLHVDTGLGKLDHHQTGEYTCAAKLALEYVKKCLADDFSGTKSAENLLVIEFSSASGENSLQKWNEDALERLVEVVNQVDHFQEVYYPDSEEDYFEFMIGKVLDGWKLLYREQDRLIVEKGLDLIDGIYTSLVSKVDAERILENESTEFDTKWGKAVYYTTKNNGVSDIAQKRGYKISVRKHPDLGHIRIKAMPKKQIKSEELRVENKLSIDLTQVYDKLMKVEEGKRGDWFLHKSKSMLLNGSAKNPTMRPTNLSLEEIVEIIKSVK